MGLQVSPFRSKQTKDCVSLLNNTRKLSNYINLSFFKMLNQTVFAVMRGLPDTYMSQVHDTPTESSTDEILQHCSASHTLV